MRLTLEAIKVIETIAKTGSFTKAGELLYKAPSTISYTVSKIEEQMGLQFFERNGPHVTLTPIGQILLDEGKPLLSAVSDLESRLNKIAKGVESSIHIAIDAIFPLTNILPLITQFQQSSVATSLTLSREVMMGAWEALLKFRADLIIAVGEGPAGGGYHTYPIGVVPFLFCVAPDHPLTLIDRPLGKNDLLAYPAIVLADSARYMPLRTVGLQEGQQRITVTTLTDKIALQKAGIGHGFLPAPLVQEAIIRGELVTLPVLEAHKEETLYLAWRTADEGLALQWWREALAEHWVR